MCYCKMRYPYTEEWWEGVGYFPLAAFQHGLLALRLQNLWPEVGREMLLFTGSLGEGPRKQGERKGTEGMWCGQILRDFSGVDGDKGQGYTDTGRRTKRPM